MNAGGADVLSRDKYAKIDVSPRFVAYLETLLDRVRIKSGYGSVTICVKDGRIHTVECTVSEVITET